MTLIAKLEGLNTYSFGGDPCVYIRRDQVIQVVKSHTGDADREDVARVIAEVQANGWDYGTHPRDKASIVIDALLSAGYRVTRDV